MLGIENARNVKTVSELRAIYDGETKRLHLRVGSQTYQTQIDIIYCHLANKDWSVVKITENGWQMEKSPILFRRYSSTGTQVIPLREYPKDIFDQFINLINIKGD